VHNHDNLRLQKTAEKIPALVQRRSRSKAFPERISANAALNSGLKMVYWTRFYESVSAETFAGKFL
jgi:hypothetical protein